jgi:hypothetical protein
MKKTIFIISLICFSAILSAQKGNFGLGIILGKPTGVSAKLWNGRTTAFDGAAAWYISGNEGAMQLHANYLKHNFEIFQVEEGQLPLYYGIGAKIVLGSDVGFGVRVPLGISYIFNNDLPLDTFLELAPTLNLMPSTGFDIDGAIGVRYYF